MASSIEGLRLVANQEQRLRAFRPGSDRVWDEDRVPRSCERRRAVRDRYLYGRQRHRDLLRLRYVLAALAMQSYLGGVGGR